MRAAVVALIACSSTTPPAVQPKPSIDQATCMSTLKTKFAIDMTPEPRACVAIYDAMMALDAPSQERVRGLQIVRTRRGPWGDEHATDIASMLLNDAAYAYYSQSPSRLTMTDALFDGPKWRYPAPSKQLVEEYLAALPLTWPELVAHVRALPDAKLPAGDLAFGDVRVFEEITRLGARVLQGQPTLADRLLHELGHAVQLSDAPSSNVEFWSSVVGWREGKDIADGYVGGQFSDEQPIVASRLVLGLPRGSDATYLAPSSTPTGYAAFDPMEDWAETVRLAHSDPVALGKLSPKRLILAASAAQLRDPALRDFIKPGVRALLDQPYADGAMKRIRDHGEALLPEIASLADDRPLKLPEKLDDEARKAIEAAHLVVEIGGIKLRPTDAAVEAFVAQIVAAVADQAAVNGKP